MKISYLCILFSCLLISACAPMRQPYTLHDEQPAMLEDGFRVSDGTVLPSMHWHVNNAKAVILAVHGFNDYSYAFDLFAKEAAEKKYAVFSYDQRGFGRNQPQGIWPGSDNLVRDFCDIAAIIKEKYPQKPLIIIAESMGGAVAIHAAATCLSFKPDAVIFSAPAAWGGESMNPFYRAVLWTIAHSLPDKTFTGEGLNVQATDNIPLLQEMSKDPNVIKSTRADSIYGLQHMMDAAYADVANPKLFEGVPVLVLYGNHDEIIPPEPVVHVTQNIPSHFVLFENGYHMLLRDLGRQRVYDYIFQWMKPYVSKR